MADVKIGDVFDVNSGGTVTVLALLQSRDCIIQYNDSSEYKQRATLARVKSGALRNPYLPSVQGVGYFGVGMFRSQDRKNSGVRSLEYRTWKAMIERCYTVTSTDNTYTDCTVCDEWHNFQTFALWYVSTGYYGYGYHLDKDLLIPNNKVYSPETCCMLPGVLNTALSMTDSMLPGISLQSSGRYVVRVSGLIAGRFVGTYDTLEEARFQYAIYKKKRILEIITGFKGKIAPYVIDALLR